MDIKEGNLKNTNDYWYGSGDAEYQMAVDKWANEKYGEDWRLKCEVYNMEKLYDTYIRKYGL